METTPKFTPDFNSMINIVIYNSVGFFFLDYLIPVVIISILGATGLELGFIVSVQVIGYLISSGFTGFLTDKVKSRAKLVLLGSFGRAIAYVILYSALILGSIFGMGIGTFSIGFFAGFFWIPLNTLIAEKSNKENRSEAYGKRANRIGIGTLVGSFIGFPIFGWTISLGLPQFLIYLPILLFGVSNFIGGILFYRNVDESIKFDPYHPEKSASGKASAQISLGIIFLSLIILLSSLNGSLARPFLNAYILTSIINDPTIAMVIFIPSGFISNFIAPKIGKYVDKLHPSLGISIGSALGALTTWALINVYNPFLFSILLTIDVSVIYFAELSFENFISRISIKHRGKVMGFRLFFSNVGTIIGPILGGIVWDYIAIRAPFIISIFVELSLIPFYIFMVYLMKERLIESYEDKI